jgi:hypothetical protein
MSWDVCVMRFSRPYASLQDMPPDERPLALGDAVLVRGAVAHAFPGTDWSDPAWGRWECPWGSIEFNLGKEEPATSMMLHVRAGPEVVPGIVSLCVDNGWQAVDCDLPPTPVPHGHSQPAPCSVAAEAGRSVLGFS